MNAKRTPTPFRGIINLSDKSDAQMQALLGTPDQPKKFHGTAIDGTGVNSFATSYDIGTSKVAVTDTEGKQISGTRHDLEVFFNQLADDSIHSGV